MRGDGCGVRDPILRCEVVNELAVDKADTYTLRSHFGSSSSLFQWSWL